MEFCFSFVFLKRQTWDFVLHLRDFVLGDFVQGILSGYRVAHFVQPSRQELWNTLSDVAAGADRDDDMIESGSVGRREISVRAVTLFDHVALIARLLTRLYTPNTLTAWQKNFPDQKDHFAMFAIPDSAIMFTCLSVIWLMIRRDNQTADNWDRFFFGFGPFCDSISEQWALYVSDVAQK